MELLPWLNLLGFGGWGAVVVGFVIAIQKGKLITQPQHDGRIADLRAEIERIVAAHNAEMARVVAEHREQIARCEREGQDWKHTALTKDETIALQAKQIDQLSAIGRTLDAVLVALGKAAGK